MSSTAETIPEDLKAILCEGGYHDWKMCSNGRIVGIMPFLYTWAIVADIDPVGYNDRWCFKTLQEANAAYEDWDGVGDPEGWHRHLPSGRRRDENGKDIGNW